MTKIYLASPYTKKNHDVAFLDACNAAALLIKLGKTVFSPIAHSHYIAKFHKLPKDVGFWRKQNQSFIDWCDELWVLGTEGWEESKGILEEIDYAKQAGKPVHYLTQKEEL